MGEEKVGLKPYDNSHLPVLTLFFAPSVASQGRFPNFKRTANQTVGAPGLANGDKAPRGVGEGRCLRSIFRKKEFQFWISNGQTWRKLRAFCTVHLKLD